MNTAKRLVGIIKIDHQIFPLSDNAIEEIKSDLKDEYSDQIADTVIYTLTNSIFYKNSILNGDYKYATSG